MDAPIISLVKQDLVSSILDRMLRYFLEFVKFSTSDQFFYFLLSFVGVFCRVSITFGSGNVAVTAQLFDVAGPGS